MKDYGLVLAGGGAKGVYQLGAWKAMREMGITFSELEALDKDEAYTIVSGRKTSFKHSSRIVLQSIYSYREFLNKTQETNQ